MRAPLLGVGLALTRFREGMDVAGNLMVVATAERHVQIFNLSAFCVFTSVLVANLSSLAAAPTQVFKSVQ